MTDELVKRLRGWRGYHQANLSVEAADRIEQLERELSISRMAQVVMDNTVEALAKADDRIEALTAERDDALRRVRFHLQVGSPTILRLLDRAEAAEADNALLLKAMTGIKRAAAHRMQDDKKDLHSYYFHTADAALTGKEPRHE